MKVFCNRCNRQTNHIVVKEEESTLRDDEAEVVFWDKYEIVKCSGCEEISFRHLSSNSDDYSPETGEPYTSVRLYPIRGEGILPIKPYYTVPPVVRNIYRETIDAYNNGLNLLCAGGMRAIIESICKQESVLDGPVEKTLKDRKTKKVVRTKDLMGKINGLQEKGIIIKKHAEILHEHRYLGNNALHSLEAPSKTTLNTAIEIIEHVLDSLYEIDRKAGELIWTRQLNEKKKVQKKK
jgi:hypothetical protein